ncbi:MAG: ABC transporter permease [Spirochaetaceae bacterium]|jgi:simple sugar transport system permease protein|nr:ABC transporter permease [Spirochaetaceae bacterium]
MISSVFSNFLTFVAGPWSSLWFAGNTLDYMALLLCASLGSAFAFRCGLFNLGLEGQIYTGGLAATCAMLFLPPSCPPFVLLSAAAAAACITGALAGLFCAFLKNISGADVLISSFLLSASLTPVADYLIAGPLRGDEGNLLATARFNVVLPHILPPSHLTLSLIFSLLLCAAAYVFISKTGAGYRFHIAGYSPAFARYGGIDAAAYYGPALGLSGALGGLCGFFAVAGTYGLCYQGFSGGLGWAGISVALIARNRFLVLIPASLFYAALKSGIEQILLSSVMSFEASYLIQAVILISAAVKFPVRTLKRRI